MKVPQVFGRVRIYSHVGKHLEHDLEHVRCLSCRQVYTKPQSGTTVGRNPGCPACGYVGWLSVVVALGEARPTPSA